MKILCCLLTAAMGFTAALTAQTKPLADTAAWRTYTDTAYEFTMRYPAAWEFKPRSTNTRFFVTSYKENDADRFRENLNCIVRVIEQQGFTARAAEAAIKKSLSEKLKDYRLIHSAYTTWNGVAALELDYTCTQESGGDTYNLRMYQRLAIIKSTLFTLTFTAEAGSYDKYVGTVKKMVQSLKVK
jgi:hypothetical protein